MVGYWLPLIVVRVCFFCTFALCAFASCRRAALAARLRASDSRGRQLELLCADLLREVAPDAPRLRWHARAAFQALRRVVDAPSSSWQCGHSGSDRRRGPADYCALPESAGGDHLRARAPQGRPYSASRSGSGDGRGGDGVGGRGGGEEDEDEDLCAAPEDAAAAAAAAKQRALQTELDATKVR